MTRCFACKRKITNPDSPNVLRQVTGWVKPRSSTLIDRQPTGELMCTSCAVSLEHGIHPDQGSLL